jgi:hypothetical protein
MAHMTAVKCKNCKTPFEARTADVNRGWGLYCSKACKARKQTSLTGVAGPDYRAEGRNVNQMRNGKYAKSKFTGRRTGSGDGVRWFPTIVIYNEWDEEVERGGVKYSHRHRCWLVKDDGSDPLIDAHPFDSDAAGFNNT